MHNRNVLIGGEPGAGKTTMAHALLQYAPRALIIDVHAEYRGAANQNVVVSSDIREALHLFAEMRDEDVQLIFRPEFPAVEIRYMLRLAHYVQKRAPENPLAIVIDEASMYGNTHDLTPEIRYLYNMGRRWRINLVGIIQVDTDIHRVLRANAHIVVAMRAGELSTRFARRFDQNAVANLTPLKPGMQPQAGIHYLTSPRNVDLFAQWKRANGIGVTAQNEQSNEGA